jgi:hypothetical protein
MKSVEFSFEVVPIGAELRNRINRSKVLPEFGISISNLQFLMATISPQKKNSSTRTWVIEGFDGSTCFFQQTFGNVFARRTNYSAPAAALVAAPIGPSRHAAQDACWSLSGRGGLS